MVLVGVIREMALFSCPLLQQANLGIFLWPAEGQRQKQEHTRFFFFFQVHACILSVGLSVVKVLPKY